MSSDKLILDAPSADEPVSNVPPTATLPAALAPVNGDYGHILVVDTQDVSLSQRTATEFVVVQALGCVVAFLPPHRAIAPRQPAYHYRYVAHFFYPRPRK
ncbi:hypothetical protein NLJ89_g8026 [Agrocybe chaxingu]|uniref:Uncharacterized protein n=1 Tax=Agrocybe chaxingu TaxID=84603 RepID=A0A9W8JW60_9AGAR|nr:hypothetical protein NLJ89_g8026 [Agrocybe chaxingu]